MQKKIVLSVMAALILSPVSCVQAADYSEQHTVSYAGSAEISPFFVGVNRITGSLSISSSGAARGMVNVFPKNSTSLDYISTTASLVNASGTKVKTWTNVKSTMNDDGYFIFDKSYTVQSRGQYKMVYTVSCYKNGVVIDTASSETASQTY